MIHEHVHVINDTSIKGSTSILAPTPEFCKCTFYTNLHICLFYTKVVRTEQMPLAGFRNPDYIRNVIYTLFMTFIQLPKKADFFSINTNRRYLDYQVSTKAIYEIIKQHPEGINLTEIASIVDPEWTDEDCKRQFKRAIDPLLLEDKVRKFQSPVDARVQIYVPTKLSKRYLFNELVKAFFDAKN